MFKDAKIELPTVGDHVIARDAEGNEYKGTVISTSKQSFKIQNKDFETIHGLKEWKIADQAPATETGLTWLDPANITLLEDATETGLTWLDPANITLIEDIQPRCKEDEGLIDEYAAAMADDKWDWELEPPTAYLVNSEIVLSHGFHRVRAARMAQKNILVDVRTGDMFDVRSNAITHNHRHGLRLTNADKRRMIGMVLDLLIQEYGSFALIPWAKGGKRPEGFDPAAGVAEALKIVGQWSARMIADICGVSDSTVREYLVLYQAEREGLRPGELVTSWENVTQQGSVLSVTGRGVEVFWFDPESPLPLLVSPSAVMRLGGEEWPEWLKPWVKPEDFDEVWDGYQVEGFISPHTRLCEIALVNGAGRKVRTANNIPFLEIQGLTPLDYVERTQCFEDNPSPNKTLLSVAQETEELVAELEEETGTHFGTQQVFPSLPSNPTPTEQISLVSPEISLDRVLALLAGVNAKSLSSMEIERLYGKLIEKMQELDKEMERRVPVSKAS